MSTILLFPFPKWSLCNIKVKFSPSQFIRGRISHEPGCCSARHHMNAPPNNMHDLLQSPSNTTDILRKTALTVPGSIHPARCGAGFCSSPSKPSCIFHSRCAPRASLKSSCRSCRALWFPPSKPYLPDPKPLCTSSRASRDPGTPPQLADSHCKEKSLLLTVCFPFLGKRIWSSQ